jgi:hypothetical protein
MNYTYTLGGIVIASEFEIEELTPSEEKADVTLKMGKTPEKLENATINKILVQVNSNEVILTIPDIAKFWIINDNEVIIEVLHPDKTADAQKYILSFILGVLSFKKGFYPLHGGGVIHNGEAYLFTAHSGAGKSTTVAGLQQRGFKSLADDICNLYIENEKIMMHPCFPRFKLWEDSLEMLNIKNVGEYKLRSDLQKFLIPVLNDFSISPVPVKRIYLLVENREGKTFMEEVLGKDKMEILRNNNYKPWMVKAFNILKEHFGLMSSISNKVEIKRFNRPLNKAKLNEMYDFLIADITGNGKS